MSLLKNHNSKIVNLNKGRQLVAIAGYYGFDNLGDEAILEELLHEVSSVSKRDNIIVFSNQPEKTTATYGVKSVNRWRCLEYIKVFIHTTLFISGGGGLFQDRTGLRSIIFYAAQIFIAKLLGAKVLIYAQGIGPLKTYFGKMLTRLAFGCADSITVRDDNSIAVLKSWGLEGQLTADPVWALSLSSLPDIVNVTIDNLRKDQQKVIGLSLRIDPAFKDYHLKYLTGAIASTYPGSSVLLLPLQQAQDISVLKQADEALTALGLSTHILDSSLLNKPSNWLALMEKLDLIIGMRLHALLMGIRAQRPVVGIAYDPKVRILLNEFCQPVLVFENGDKENTGDSWLEIIRKSKNNEFNQTLKDKLTLVEKSAHQNAMQLANMLKV